MLPAIVSLPDAITPHWLNQTLAAHNPAFEHAEIIDVDYQMIGTGKMGDNARLTIKYSSDSHTGRLPHTLVAKLPAADPVAKQMSASSGAYAREVLFYQQQAQLTEMHLPKIYYSASDEAGEEFIILMEDMAPAEPGDQLLGETIHRAEMAIDQAAKLHAAFWESDKLDGEHISRPYEEENAAFGGALLLDAWPKFLERFSHGLAPEAIAFGDLFVASYSQWIGRFKGPKTLVHSDFRSENILFNDHGENASAITVDWQSIAISCGLTDIAYFIGGSLTSELRRQHEKTLVSRYRSALELAGVKTSEAECWEQYREFAMNAFMTVILGAVYTGAAERSDKMFLIMAQRHFQQCLDLHSAEFLSI
tara:strand:- start:260 stop:1351 length:1092 start_codon:yes stop_codon:yes gene_type:complete